jgi:hypothetical protein
VFSCTERITPLEEEEIGIKTTGKVTRIAITITRMVRYMVFDISEILLKPIFMHSFVPQYHF